MVGLNRRAGQAKTDASGAFCSRACSAAPTSCSRRPRAGRPAVGGGSGGDGSHSATRIEVVRARGHRSGAGTGRHGCRRSQLQAGVRAREQNTGSSIGGRAARRPVCLRNMGRASCSWRPAWFDHRVAGPIGSECRQRGAADAAAGAGGHGLGVVRTSDGKPAVGHAGDGESRSGTVARPPPVRTDSEGRLHHRSVLAGEVHAGDGRQVLWSVRQAGAEGGAAGGRGAAPGSTRPAGMTASSWPAGCWVRMARRRWGW